MEKNSLAILGIEIATIVASMKLLPITNRTEQAMVDDEDYERLLKFSWCMVGYDPRVSRSYIDYKFVNTQYGRTVIKKYIRVPLPNEVMQYHERMYDHIDRNFLNNQKSNLRLATQSQNCMNKVKLPGGTSRYKGVSWSKMNNRWESRITVNRKTLRIGFFSSEIEAARAYNIKAKELHGEFGVLNKIEGEEENGNGTTE